MKSLAPIQAYSAPRISYQAIFYAKQKNFKPGTKNVLFV